MDKKSSLIIYLSFVILYIISIIYNYFNNSPWILDNLLSLGFLILIFSSNKWLKLSRFDFLLLNLALIFHNLGMFGFYNWEYSFIGYDTIVHFISASVAAYIIFKIISKKLHIKKNKCVKKTVVDEHKAILIFLVIASVIMLGTMIELMEFTGSKLIGESDTFFSPGLNEGGFDNYTDTMSDTIVNLIGSIFGIAIYYLFKVDKKICEI